MMKRTYIYTFFLILLCIGFISCDDYKSTIAGQDPTFTKQNMTVGSILLENHNTISLDRYGEAVSAGHRAVAVIFAGKTEEHPALAVMLQETSGALCDSLGLSCGAGTDITKYDGITNTTAIFATGKSRLSNDFLTFHANGQSDYIPGVAEMRLLCKSLPVVNPVISQVGGTPLDVDGDTWYWTSTEVAANTNYQAWLCSSVNGGIIETPKSEQHKVRAILEINYPD